MILGTPNFVVILSERSLDRCRHRGDWLRREISHAIQAQHNIVPVFMPGFQMPKSMRLAVDIARWRLITPSTISMNTLIVGCEN